MSQALYRFWNADDVLLYVGITVRPWQRWKEHRAEKEWWHEVAKVTIEQFETRDEVRAAESQAIRSESPVYNIQGRVEASAPAPKHQPVENWDGIHAPFIAFIGNLYWCACAEPDWEDPRIATGAGLEPCGSAWREHDDNCPDCTKLEADWRNEQPFFEPEEYAAHVIAAVLGESFEVERLQS